MVVAIGKLTDLPTFKEKVRMHPQNVNYGLLGYPVLMSADILESEDWKRLCQMPEIDLVYISTPWEQHTEMAVYAMQQGKHVAIEVPLAMSVADCWKIVRTAEETQRPINAVIVPCGAVKLIFRSTRRFSV